MIDRLEELLAALEDENEEKEREDVPALTDRTVPVAAAPEEDGGEAVSGSGKSEPRSATAAAGGEAVSDGGAGGPRSVPVSLDADKTERAAAETADADGIDAAEEPEDGPVWKLSAGAVKEAEAAWRRELAERQGQLSEAAAEGARLAAEGLKETAVERLSVEKGGELARAVRHESEGRELVETVRHEAESGLEGLYRQTVQASRPAPQALPMEQAGRTLRAEEPGRTAALTVDELDRAVRRDSRRYDGGMTIF